MELTKQQKSIFDGLMLSDASIELGNRRANARFSLTSKHLGFVTAVRSVFPQFSWADTTKRDIFDKRTNKAYHSCNVRTHVDEFFTKQYYRWYVNGTKIVPSDIKIDKDLLEWWYIGDGHLCRKKSRPNYRRVILATDSFSQDEREVLVNKLCTFLHNDNVYVEQRRTVVIAKHALVKMAQILTDCPVAEYSYKYDFGKYRDENYFELSYSDRPLQLINQYRRKHKVRELNFEEIKQEMKK